MSGVREELLDRQAEVLGLPAVKVMIPAACPKLYEQWMASVLATDPARDYAALSYGPTDEVVAQGPHRQPRRDSSPETLAGPGWRATPRHRELEAAGIGRRFD